MTIQIEDLNALPALLKELIKHTKGLEKEVYLSYLKREMLLDDARMQAFIEEIRLKTKDPKIALFLALYRENGLLGTLAALPRQMDLIETRIALIEKALENHLVSDSPAEWHAFMRIFDALHLLLKEAKKDNMQNMIVFLEKMIDSPLYYFDWIVAFQETADPFTFIKKLAEKCILSSPLTPDLYDENLAKAVIRSQKKLESALKETEKFKHNLRQIEAGFEQDFSEGTHHLRDLIKRARSLEKKNQKKVREARAELAKWERLFIDINAEPARTFFLTEALSEKAVRDLKNHLRLYIQALENNQAFLNRLASYHANEKKYAKKGENIFYLNAVESAFIQPCLESSEDLILNSLKDIVKSHYAQTAKESLIRGRGEWLAFSKTHSYLMVSEVPAFHLQNTQYYAAIKRNVSQVQPNLLSYTLENPPMIADASGNLTPIQDKQILQMALLQEYQMMAKALFKEIGVYQGLPLDYITVKGKANERIGLAAALFSVGFPLNMISGLNISPNLLMKHPEFLHYLDLLKKYPSPCMQKGVDLGRTVKNAREAYSEIDKSLSGSGVSMGIER